MRGARHVFRKEFGGYFFSPIAYIVIAVFLVVTGWFFFSTFFLYDQAELRNFFRLLPLVFSFVIPAVTMRLFSEEFHSGSYELLLTLPVTPGEVTVGKFLAATAFTGIMLLPTLCYAVTVAFLGDLDWGPAVGGYLGALLLAAAYAAVGLLASALTRNQIIAFILGAAVCVTLTLIDKILFFLPRGILGVFQYLAADAHFRNIAKGVVDSRDLLYFASVAVVTLYATTLVIEERK